MVACSETKRRVLVKNEPANCRRDQSSTSTVLFYQWSPYGGGTSKIMSSKPKGGDPLLLWFSNKGFYTNHLQQQPVAMKVYKYSLTNAIVKTAVRKHYTLNNKAPTGAASFRHKYKK